jgi:hypothetical protein
MTQQATGYEANKPLANAAHWVRNHSTPTTLAGGVGLLAGATAYGLFNPLQRTARTMLSRVPGETIDDINESPPDFKTKLKGAALIGALASAGTWAALDKPLTWKGLTKWGSFGWTGFDGLDFSPATRISGHQALSMFRDDPNLFDSPYERNFGTAIVANACNRQGTSRPTLGGIVDSAIQKFDNKLNWQGVASTAVAATIANAQANLFANALGTMFDLDKGTRNKLIEAGTWAGAVRSILK